MKTTSLSISYDVLLWDELTEDEKQIVEAAKEATSTSFSPYSHFSVGACVALDNGMLVRGSNQESAAYTTGICAERCAMFYANAHYPGVGVKAVSIAARGLDGEFTPAPISPCGSCRQVLSEVESRYHDYALYLYGAEKIYRFRRFSDLMPLHFSDDSLK